MDAPTPPKKATNPREAPFRAPASLAMRWAVVGLHNDNAVAAFGASLGLCWTGPGRPRTQWTPRDPAQYGMAVVDELLAREGVSMRDVVEVGGQVFAEYIAAGLVYEAEVQEHLGNSEAGSAG